MFQQSMVSFRSITAVWLMFLMASAPGVFAGEVISIGGAGSGLGVIKQLADEFEKIHPDVTFRILPSLGSSGGIKAVLQGALQIGISGRQLKEEEQAQGVVGVRIASTPFIFITNARVNRPDMAIRELEQI